MATNSRFTNAINTVIETKRIEREFNKQARNLQPTNLQATNLEATNLETTNLQPANYLVKNDSTINLLNKKIKALECSIKKLELKLRLVDEEYIEKTEFDKLISNIIYKCDKDDKNDKDDTTKNFIIEMKKKREDNNNKTADDEHTELVDFFNLYLPTLSLFAAIAISYLSTIEITPTNIVKSTAIFNMFILNFIKTIKPFIEDSATYTDLYSKAFGLYPQDINNIYKKITVAATPIATPIATTLVNPIKTTIINKSNTFYSHLPDMLKNATQNISKHILSIIGLNKEGSKIQKLTLAFTTFYIAVYFIILYVYMIIGNNETNDIVFKFINITNPRGSQITRSYGGGKKVKKAKKQKNKSINRKII
jgi:hypothetical protein